MGGQTGLNCALDLAREGVLTEKYNVELIAAPTRRSHRHGRGSRPVPQVRHETRSGSKVRSRAAVAHTLEEALREVQKPTIGFPTVIRPSFTMGGTGGGIAYNLEEFKQHRFACAVSRCRRRPRSCWTSRCIGWKEYEMEVVRDAKNDNCIIVCSIENSRPDGRTYRRLDHGCTGADADGQANTSEIRDASIAVSAQNRRGDRRLQCAVLRSMPADTGRVLDYRNEPARVALIGAGLQGDRFPDRESRRKARGGLHARRIAVTTSRAVLPRRRSSPPSITSSPRFRASRSRSFREPMIA